jgi:hypothetical protein
MKKMTDILSEAGTAYLREHPSSPPVFGGVRVAHLFSFLCVVCLDCPFFIALSVFSNVYLIIMTFLETLNLNSKYFYFFALKNIDLDMLLLYHVLFIFRYL